MPRLSNEKITGTNPPQEGDVTITVDEAAAPDSPLQANPAHVVSASPAYVVVADVVSWREPVPGTVPPKTKVKRRFLGRGMPDDVPEGEIERLLAAGAIAVPEQVAEVMATRVTGRAEPAGEIGDKRLRELDQITLIAYLTQHPEEAERVHRIETARAAGARAAVLAAVGADPETGELLE